MSLIDNVHASVQGLLNRGPMGGHGPHNGGGRPEHSHGHDGANGRGFGGPRGGDVPRASPPGLGGPPGPPSTPGLPNLPNLPMPGGVDRPQVGQTPHGVERPNPGHGHGHGPQVSPGPVVQGALNVAQGLVNALSPPPAPGGPPAHAQAHGHAQHGGQAGAPLAAMAGQPALAGMQAGAGTPMQAAGAAASTPATTASAMPGPAAAAMAQQAGAPLRADPAPLQAVPQPRGDALAPSIGRGDMAMAGMARADAGATVPVNAPANTAATNLAAAATAAVSVMATAATAPALPAAQAADARNVAGLTVADRAQGVRAEAMTGTYTGEGPQRRRLRRGAGALPASLSALLTALGAQGNTSAARDARQMERELQATAMQWLFWLLAIIAYGCVAFAVIGLLPPGGGVGVAATPGRGWSGGFAVAGLLAAGGAWWFARHLARGDAPPPRRKPGEE